MAAITLTNDTFQQEVLSSSGVVLVDFWASWCGPCQMMAPVVDEIAAAYPSVKVGKVNVDEQQELAMQFHIESIPTFMIFKNGVAAHRLVGVQPKEAITALLK